MDELNRGVNDKERVAQKAPQQPNQSTTHICPRDSLTQSEGTEEVERPSHQILLNDATYANLSYLPEIEITEPDDSETTPGEEALASSLTTASSSSSVARGGIARQSLDV